MSATRHPCPADPRDLPTILREVEAHLREGTRLRAERAAGHAAGHADERGASLLCEIQAAVARDPAAAARHARRLRAACAGLALQAREIPADALDGLYEDVRAAAADASTWNRARMSEAFLDAPLQLQRWRGAALAACAVLALGAGLFAGGRLGFDDDAGSRALEREDPRDHLLRRLDAGPIVPAAPHRSAGTLVNDLGAPPMAEPPTPFFVFYGGPRRAGEAQRWLDAVLQRAPGETREVLVERN